MKYFKYPFVTYRASAGNHLVSDQANNGFLVNSAIDISDK